MDLTVENWQGREIYLSCVVAVGNLKGFENL